MMLAVQPPPVGAVRHARNRPKLSLQISPASMLPPIARTPSSALSPTSRNTLLNRNLTAPSPSPSSSSSSSSDEEPGSPSLRTKSPRRRMAIRRHTPMKSSYHPTTPSASFMPRPKPEQRPRAPPRAKRVGFSDRVIVHLIEDVVADMADDIAGDQRISEMEKAKEIERLKEWVAANSPEEEAATWVRKLVELEMQDIEMEDAR